MVQNKPKRPRGRPKTYDPDQALAQAMDVFWASGYAATSLDQLGAATGMNRPSLYGAFGDKRELYLKVLQRYGEAGEALQAQALAGERGLREELRQTYRAGLELYCSGDDGPRGCLLIGTAMTEAAGDPEVRKFFAARLHGLDARFERRLRLARERGELSRDADPALLARHASSVLHSLAIRTRAGESRKTLEKDIELALDLICGSRKQ